MIKGKVQEMNVTLRKLDREDLKHFYVWASDPEVAKTKACEAITSLDEAEKFLIEVAEKHPYFKTICLDDLPIGSVTLLPVKEPRVCKAELGYVLSRAYWGKGIATRAVQMVLESGFEELGVNRIEAFVEPSNLASQKVLAKAGMTCEGLLKNHVFYKGSIRDRFIYSKSKT